ncbi:hypothetical protein [Phyllobacterium chamaecytisi]|uniref:hypothetical protein n=1 Tax=Phyllobacterium chamaecytisi TaxID=2876082 RepID=UPI001CCFF10B|nr:hypothetical protein [Phyllobacterium sp. KW56]MBZ9603992.1 hypothetical protein [Phyllobacterium sp. KW56]
MFSLDGNRPASRQAACTSGFPISLSVHRKGTAIMNTATVSSALFDPMKKASWSLPMTVSWIIHKDPDKVRDQDDAYRAKCRDLVAHQAVYQQVRGHFGDGSRGPDILALEVKSAKPELRQRSKATLLGLLLETIGLSPDMDAARQQFKDAEKDLFDALIEGRLVATANDCQTQSRDPIPAHQWQDLQPGGSPETGLQLLLQGKPKYRDITILRSDILKLWKLDGGATGVTVSAEMLEAVPVDEQLKSSTPELKGAHKTIGDAVKVLMEEDRFPDTRKERINAIIAHWDNKGLKLRRIPSKETFDRTFAELGLKGKTVQTTNG